MAEVFHPPALLAKFPTTSLFPPVSWGKNPKIIQISLSLLVLASDSGLRDSGERDSGFRLKDSDGLDWFFSGAGPVLVSCWYGAGMVLGGSFM
jgi:hypothetical protein